MKICYVPKRFNAGSLALIGQANAIIEQYNSMGYALTLRQLYYQLVAAEIIPNNLKSYKRLASLINDARWAGEVDWEAIEDRMRETTLIQSWGDPDDLLDTAQRAYREDLWLPQPVYLEVMVEKDAVSNIVAPVCNRFRVPFTANRGYPSASLLHDVAQRLDRQAGWGKQLCIIYLGDHDPSGLDMDRDIRDRLALFAQIDHEADWEVEVERIALTDEQIKKWRLPENPAKTTDARYDRYEALHGTKSWELDAIPAQELESLLRQAIVSYIDDDLWDDSVAHEKANRAKIGQAREWMRSQP